MTIISINTCIFNNRTSVYMKPNLREFARGIGNSIIITRYLNISQHLIEWGKISKDMHDLFEQRY